MKIEKLVLELQKIAAEHPESEVKFKGTASTLWCDQTVASKTIVTDITEVKYSEKHNAVMVIQGYETHQENGGALAYRKLIMKKDHIVDVNEMVGTFSGGCENDNTEQ